MAAWISAQYKPGRKSGAVKSAKGTRIYPTRCAAILSERLGETWEQLCRIHNLHATDVMQSVTSELSTELVSRGGGWGLGVKNGFLFFCRWFRGFGRSFGEFFFDAAEVSEILGDF